MIMDQFYQFDAELKSEENNITKFVNGFESIIRQKASNTSVIIGGVESHTTGIMRAEGIGYNQYAGHENFVTEGIKKLYDMIVYFLKSVWNFFFGNTRWAMETKSNIKVAEKEFLNLRLTTNPRLNKLKEIYYPLVADFKNIEPLTSAILQVKVQYNDIAGGTRHSIGRKLSDISYVVTKISKEMEANVQGEKDSWAISSLTTTWFNNAQKLCDTYEELLKELKTFTDSSEFKNLLSEKTDQAAKATKLLNGIKKLTKIVGDKFAKLAKAFDKAAKVKEGK